MPLVLLQVLAEVLLLLLVQVLLLLRLVVVPAKPPKLPKSLA